jgi:hypothetical protein
MQRWSHAGIARRFAPENAQRATGDAVALEIERVVDGGVGGEETLGCAG